MTREARNSREDAWFALKLQLNGEKALPPAPKLLSSARRVVTLIYLFTCCWEVASRSPGI